ncbi:MAG: polyprenyl synthetase family protein [Campylobacterales bacterium]|nr:polyprenyl synthetase family protein [Campylobacterales bacterium]
METFEAYFLANLPVAPSFHPHYEEALQAMLKAGGKRFRPMLLLKVVEHLAPLLLEHALPVAASIEMMHTYSLIHDDLPAMDDSPLRRGHPTLHVSHDEVTAILIGDALNTHAFAVLASAPLSALVRIRLVEALAVSAGAGGMVLGQAIDCHFENQPLSLEALEFLHTNKTAKLIAASLKMGAIIANSGEEMEHALEAFGLKLGVLFQIQDDVIDATQTSQEAGKPTGNDGVKNSFTNLLGVKEALARRDGLATALCAEAQNIGGALGDDLARIVEMYFIKGM